MLSRGSSCRSSIHATYLTPVGIGTGIGHREKSRSGVLELEVLYGIVRGHSARQQDFTRLIGELVAVDRLAEVSVA